jgi:hypothetical protein
MVWSSIIKYSSVEWWRGDEVMICMRKRRILILFIIIFGIF